MILLLSNRDDWRLAAGPNDWGHVFLYDGILDHAFYKAFDEIDGRRDLQPLCDFEKRMESVLLAIEPIITECFEEPHGLSHEHPQIAFDGVSGAILEVRDGGLKPAAKTFTVMTGLHEGHFAGTMLRLLFFLCGIMGCAMIATGVVLWSLARLPKAGERPFLGLRLVQALNVGSIAGLPAAVAVYFLANRLLPVDLAGREEWEIRAFFGAWIVAALVPLARPQRRAWCEGLAAVSVLFLAVVAADILTIPDHPLRRAGGDPLFAWFDGAMLLLAGLFALAARKVLRYEAPKKAHERDRAAKPAPVPAAAQPARRPEPTHA